MSICLDPGILFDARHDTKKAKIKRIGEWRFLYPKVQNQIKHDVELYNRSRYDPDVYRYPSSEMYIKGVFKFIIADRAVHHRKTHKSILHFSSNV